MTLSICIVWHIWKERGRRIFEQEAMPANALCGIIRADLVLLLLAKGQQLIAEWPGMSFLGSFQICNLNSIIGDLVPPSINAKAELLLFS
jgi:hypothetical protein